MQEMAKVRKTKHGSRFLKFRKWLPVYVLMAPALVYLFINNYIPMAGIIVAFKNINYNLGIWNSPWVGLKNFKYLFATSDVVVITRNTLLYNLAFIIVNAVVGIFLAILITEVRNKKAKKLYQSMILVPFLLSWVIASYIVFGFLSAENGFINNAILPLFGNNEGISWYMSPKYWPFIIVIVNTWKGVGYGCLIYIATINSIDKSLYEAASLDGANRLKQIYYVMLPFLKNTVITLTLLNIGRIFYSDFGLFYQVPQNSGQLLSTTNVIDTYVYRALLQSGDTGMSAAAGLYQSIVGFAMVMVSNLIVRKVDRESALF